MHGVERLYYPGMHSTLHSSFLSIIQYTMIINVLLLLLLHAGYDLNYVPGRARYSVLIDEYYYSSYKYPAGYDAGRFTRSSESSVPRAPRPRARAAHAPRWPRPRREARGQHCQQLPAIRSIVAVHLPGHLDGQMHAPDDATSCRPAFMPQGPQLRHTRATGTASCSVSRQGMCQKNI